jgi:hypothetical protein
MSEKWETVDQPQKRLENTSFFAPLEWPAVARDNSLAGVSRLVLHVCRARRRPFARAVP